MTHYYGMVLTRSGENYDDVVAPFCEMLELPLHVNMTRDQIIDDEINWAKRTIEDNASNASQRDMDIVSGKISRDEIYNQYRERSNEKFDEDGSSLTTYNDAAKWDWYSNPEDDPVWDYSGKITAGELENQLRVPVSKILGTEINDYDEIDVDKLNDYFGEKIQPLEKQLARINPSSMTDEQKKRIEDNRNHWEIMPDWFVRNIAYTDNNMIPHWKESSKVLWFGLTGDGMSDGEWIKQLLKILHENADSTAWMIDFHI